jgi:hypothetical protein
MQLVLQETESSGSSGQLKSVVEFFCTHCKSATVFSWQNDQQKIEWIDFNG